MSSLFLIKKHQKKLDKRCPFCYNTHMTKTKKTNEKKPLTKEQIKNTLDEFRETAELFRQRGFNARVYGVTRSTRRGRARA